MSTYIAFFTQAGLSKLSAGGVAGQPLSLVRMVLGDGNGAPTTPLLLQEALVHERYSAATNRVTQAAAGVYYVELVVPAGVGGFTVREVGIYDAANVLCVVANFPATYLAVAADGAISDMVIRIQVITANVGTLTLQMDPNTAVASQAWVTARMTPAFLLPGGTTHQLLRKISNADGEVEWADPSATSVLISTLEETKVATAGQTTFALTSTTTLGLAVYVKSGSAAGGERIPHVAGAGGWQQGSSNVQVVLGTALAAGDKVTFTQNEPAGNLPRPLEASLNLSDVVSAEAARVNLSVYSRAESDQLAPAGIVDHFDGLTPPTGWLVRDGAQVSRAVYTRLFAQLGTRHGAGDGATTFALPDDRGLFDRGLDLGRGLDVGRALGSQQADAVKSHTHGIQATGSDNSFPGGRVADASPPVTSTVQTDAYGELETRPINRAYLPIIKF